VTVSRATIAGWVVQTIAIVLAFMICRRRPQHRPFAVWAAVVLAEDIIRRILNVWPLDAPRPYTGALRALFHVDQALFLLEPFGLAAVCWIVFLSRRARAPLLAGVAAWAALALGYPWPFRGVVLGYIYAGIQALSILASGASMVIWTRRKAHPRPEHTCGLLATLLTCALFSGPYAPRAPAPFDDWSFAELVYLSLWSALAVVQAFAIWGGYGFEERGRDRPVRLQ
jgi:hypothetical protein